MYNDNFIQRLGGTVEKFLSSKIFTMFPKVDLYAGKKGGLVGGKWRIRLV